MLLQTNSYIVPKDKRAEHARVVRRFRQALAKLGCDNFEVYEQVGSNWNAAEPTGRYVQIMRFRDRRHQLAVQAAERNDPGAQAIIAEFCDLINFPYQQQQGLFAVGFYNAVLPSGRAQAGEDAAAAEEPAGVQTAGVEEAPPEPSAVAEQAEPPHEPQAVNGEPTFADNGHAVDAAPQPTIEAEPSMVDEGSLVAGDADEGALAPAAEEPDVAVEPGDLAAVLDPHLDRDLADMDLDVHLPEADEAHSPDHAAH